MIAHCLFYAAYASGLVSPIIVTGDLVSKHEMNYVVDFSSLRDGSEESMNTSYVWVIAASACRLGKK